MEKDSIKKTFIGVVFDPDDKELVYVAVLDFEKRLCAHESFIINPEHFEKIWSDTAKNKYSEDLNYLGNFLNKFSPDPLKSDVLIGLPITSEFNQKILDVNEICQKIILYLSSNKYGAVAFDIFEDEKRIAQSIILKDSPEEYAGHSIMFLEDNLIGAYGNFVSNLPMSSKRNAIVAALIAKCKSLYYYLNSNGFVHTAQELEQFMKMNQESSTILSGYETFEIKKWPGVTLKNYDQIVFEYASQTNQHFQLTKHNAYKFALLHICQMLGILLYCYSELDKREEKPIECVYDPTKTIDSWILESLGSFEGVSDQTITIDSRILESSAALWELKKNITEENSIFISHSHKDSYCVNELVTYLVKEEIPSVIYSQLNLEGSWNNTVVEKIIGCKVFILMMSKYSDESQIIHKQLEIALSENKVIIPILVDYKPFERIKDLHYLKISEMSHKKSDFVEQLRDHVSPGVLPSLKLQKRRIREFSSSIFEIIFGSEINLDQSLIELDELDWTEVFIYLTEALPHIDFDHSLDIDYGSLFPTLADFNNYIEAKLKWDDIRYLRKELPGSESTGDEPRRIRI